MKWRALLFAMLIVIISVAPAFANVGTRGSSLGGAYTAVVDDASAAYWNPAGLQVLNHHELQFNYIRLDHANNMYYLSYAEPDYGTGSGAISVIHHNDKNDSKKTSITYSVAKDIYGPLAAGLTIRYQTETGPELKYLTSDLGLQFQGDAPIRVGIIMKDFINMALQEQSEELTTNVKIGTAIIIPEFGLFSIDIDDVLDGFEADNLKFGAEWNVTELVALRAGWSSSFTAGIGFSYGNWKIDYAKVDKVHQLGLNWSF